jgi:hypothetical protein
MAETAPILPALQASLDRVRAEENRRESAEIIQLPLWAEQKRGTPNSFLRSSLFAAVQGKDRRFMKEEVLASQNGITVKFTGEQLNQSDLDVWETLVHLARQHPLGHICGFTAHGLLRALGLHTCNSDHKWLHSVIIPLTACAVQITHDKKTYFGSLIESGVKDELTRHYNIKLNRDLIRLYGRTQWTDCQTQRAAGICLAYRRTEALKCRPFIFPLTEATESGTRFFTFTPNQGIL